MQVFTSNTCLAHDPGPGRPDRPERLEAVLATLGTEATIAVSDAGPAPLDAMLLRHDRSYLEHLEEVSRAGGGVLDPDTTADRHSWQAVRGATGAALAALGHATETGGNAFAAIRPPGHHALRGAAMGFCFVNHVAVLAAEARRQGSNRVLIVDWDVHHGNGTQALVEMEPDTRFVSMHQWPWYPGTGAVDERGVGNCFNVPMPPGQPREVYREALWNAVSRAGVDWPPDVILLSAGYDAMQGDPLGGFTLEPEDYADWIGRLRERFPATPIVGVMEGGYAPDRLAAGVLATVRAMQ
jgi:acetoin utilization deacetylase AcuC-like enzyme